MKQNLLGPDENKQFLIRGFNSLVRILPCSKKFAIATLHFELGHCTDYVRTELIDTFIEIGLIKCDQKFEPSLTPQGKAFKQRANSELTQDSGELPTDEKGNHIPEKKVRKPVHTAKPQAQPKPLGQKSPFYCSSCDTDYGSEKTFKEHMDFHDKGLIPEKKSLSEVIEANKKPTLSFDERSKDRV